jgi:hypothetical protein
MTDFSVRTMIRTLGLLACCVRSRFAGTCSNVQRANQSRRRASQKGDSVARRGRLANLNPPNNFPTLSVPTSWIHSPKTPHTYFRAFTQSSACLILSLTGYRFQIELYCGSLLMSCSYLEERDQKLEFTPRWQVTCFYCCLLLH